MGGNEWLAGIMMKSGRMSHSGQTCKMKQYPIVQFETHCKKGHWQGVIDRQIEVGWAIAAVKVEMEMERIEL